jgi:hypothetical protein
VGGDGRAAQGGPPERTALVLTGGPHPFAETTPIVAGLLHAAGYRTEVVDDPDAAAGVLARRPPDLWVCNTLRWRMLAPRYDELRADFAYQTTDAVRTAFDDYVRSGGALLALHAAPICFDDWLGWGDILGARWDWERSSHPALGEMEVVVVAEHPITRGVDRFTILDEAYGRMLLAADVEPLAVSRWEGEDHPMLWMRAVGEGRVVVSTLGHGRESFEHPAHQRLLRQAIGALSGREVAT